MAAETKMAATTGEKNGDAAAVTALSELTALLSPSSPASAEAAEAALSLSGSASGRALLAAHPAALSALSAMAASASRGSHTALSALVNASSEPAALEPLLAALPSLLPLFPSSGGVCGVLANLSRDAAAAPRVLRALGPGAEPLLRALSAARPPAELGALLCNLSQAPEGRRALLERSGRVVRAMLALVRWKGSAELRRGVVGALRNCCFEHEQHRWLLGPEVEALPALLLPLAGNEEIPESRAEQLPLDLQYLPPEHQREEEPEIRKMLLETLLLLTATKAGRLQLRSQGCYLVLRELHSWEQEPQVLNTCEKVIQVLIGDEPEAGMENLLEVTIPEELEQRLARPDTEGQPAPGDTAVAPRDRDSRAQPAPGDTAVAPRDRDSRGQPAPGDTAVAPRDRDSRGQPAPGDTAVAPRDRDSRGQPAPGDTAVAPRDRDSRGQPAPGDTAVAPRAAR